MRTMTAKLNAWLGVLAVGAAVLGGGAARADTAAGGVGFILYSGAIVLPSEVGADVAVRSGAPSRFRLGWAMQMPFCFLAQATHECGDGRDPLMRHRAVFALHLAWGRQVDSAGQDRSPTVDMRFGYSYRFRHDGRLLAPYLGAGVTLDFWPGCSAGATGCYVRAALSPEIGIHLGKDKAFFPGLVVGLQGDAYFADAPRARIMAFVGWTVL